MKYWTLLTVLVTTAVCLAPVSSWAGETKIVLRDYVNQQWTNELLTYPFTAAKGTCMVNSVTLTGPRGAVPVQLSDITYWPKSKWVKSATLSFIADLAPLTTDTYLVRYGKKPVLPDPHATDLKVVLGKDQVEITTSQCGARLLLGEKTYPTPVAASEIPGPVATMRLADGTWYGGSEMYGPGKLTGYSAKLTDNGPVFARVAIRYTYENGNTMDMRLQIAAGDNTMRCETQVKQDQSADGVHLVLSRGLPQLVFQVQDERRYDRPCFPSKKPGGWEEIPLKDYVGTKARNIWTRETQPGYEIVTSLTPWEDWFGTWTQRTIRLKLAGTERELQVHSLEPGVWVEPKPIADQLSPDVDPDPAKGVWVPWAHKLLPVIKAQNGDIMLQVTAAQGVRKWLISECRSSADWKNMTTGPAPETRPTLSYRLNEVKDMVLDWPGDEGTHPRLFVSRSDLEAFWKRKDADPALIRELSNIWGFAGAYLLSGDPEVAAKTHLVGHLRKYQQAELSGTQFGVGGTAVTFLYDAVIDSPMLTDAERKLVRAQMAYYGYRLTDPAVWDLERGYCSGNFNMTQVWELSRGMLACAIPDHPMAREWYRKASVMMEQMLDYSVGPCGETVEPIGRHGPVAPVLAFAIVSTRGGLHDYQNDPRIKRMMAFYAKLSTPRDPRTRGAYNNKDNKPNRRYLPAYSRDPLTSPLADCGIMARFMRESDPEYSTQLQWAWLEQGGSYQFGSMGGGFEFVYCDKRLPAKTPAWISEVLPRAGAVLRHGLGTPDEHQVQLYVDGYPSQIGSLPSIFAYGKPVAGSFTGSYQWQADDLLTCHVALARGVGTQEERQALSGYAGSSKAVGFRWNEETPARFGEREGWANISRFSALPRQDYVAADVALHHTIPNSLNFDTTLPAWPPVPKAGKPPVDWRRQVLYLKDDDATQATYLLMRDTVTGGQPTMWQMWTVSETVDTPDRVKDVAAVLAAKPGVKILPARELKGDRFTAIGQFDVDVEYYIASPSQTLRHTLRWVNYMWDPGTKLKDPEPQDLLHLQMPGDGAYYVAFFPRKRNTPAPIFSTLGNGTIIKVEGDFGKDYGFLSALEATASGEGASFTGTVASIQDRASGLVLALGAKGDVRYKGFGLTTDFAASLRTGNKTLAVEFPEKVIDGDKTMQPMIPFPGGTVTVTAPGEWAQAKPVKGVKLTKAAAGWTLTVPAGVRAVDLMAK
ncbi:MAG: hypothetical protein ACYC7E_09490 [Armatimonadota bacterium]